MGLVGKARRLARRAVLDRLRDGRRSLSLYAERLLAVDKAALAAALHRLGLRPGDLVYVQSSYDQMRSIRATPIELIGVLCEAVGEAGTVAMPTFPMTDLSQDYLDEHPFFDWRRTPSRSGLLTEVFRRMPGTERSLHPTHPVAARGRDARWLTEGHERSQLPFDGHSPFQRLLDRDAWNLNLGRFDAMTFRHLADHLMQDRIPFPIYTDRPTTVRAVGRDGRERPLLTRGHNPAITCDHAIVLERAAAEGLLRTARAGRVPLSLIRTREYVEAYQRLYRQGLLRHRLRSGTPA